MPKTGDENRDEKIQMIDHAYNFFVMIFVTVFAAPAQGRLAKGFCEGFRKGFRGPCAVTFSSLDVAGVWPD